MCTYCIVLYCTILRAELAYYGTTDCVPSMNGYSRQCDYLGHLLSRLHAVNIQQLTFLVHKLNWVVTLRIVNMAKTFKSIHRPVINSNLLILLFLKALKELCQLALFGEQSQEHRSQKICRYDHYLHCAVIALMIYNSTNFILLLRSVNKHLKILPFV